jgi:hypothetical protein
MPPCRPSGPRGHGQVDLGDTAKWTSGTRPSGPRGPEAAGPRRPDAHRPPAPPPTRTPLGGAECGLEARAPVAAEHLRVPAGHQLLVDGDRLAVAGDLGEQAPEAVLRPLTRIGRQPDPRAGRHQPPGGRGGLGAEALHGPVGCDALGRIDPEQPDALLVAGDAGDDRVAVHHADHPGGPAVRVGAVPAAGGGRRGVPLGAAGEDGEDGEPGGGQHADAARAACHGGSDHGGRGGGLVDWRPFSTGRNAPS